MFRIIAILLMLAVAMPSDAQHLEARLSHYSTANGLSSNSIAEMKQDDYGYLWLATWNGLSRFDGTNFCNYRTGAASRIPHLHNRVKTLAIDTRQNVWMRMYDNRVFVLKRSEDRIINPFSGIEGGDDFFTTNDIAVTSAGYVIVDIKGKGLYRMQLTDEGISHKLITTGDYQISSIVEGYHDDIWVGTDKGVHRLDITNLTVERKGYFLDEQITSLFSNGYNIWVGTQSGKILQFSYGQEPQELRRGNTFVYEIFVDSHGLVWFCDGEAGVSMYDPETHNETRYSQTVVSQITDPYSGSFCESNGILWVRMSLGGYGYYNREKNVVEYFHNNPTEQWTLSNVVFACCEVNEGVIWESTLKKGLEKLELLRSNILRLPLIEGSTDPTDNEIRAIAFDPRRQQVLMGNKAGKLVFITKTGQRSMITADNEGKSLGRIYGLMVGRDGSYWVSSKDNGLTAMHYSGGGFAFTHYRHSDDDSNSLSSDAVYATIEDAKGRIWVATFGGGVNVITKDKNGRVKVLNAQNGGIKGHPTTGFLKMRTLAADATGRVWAGSTDGILLFDERNGDIICSEMPQSEEDPEAMLMSCDVICIETDRNGTLWVGTNGGGLAHVTGYDKNGAPLFETFSSPEGLPSEEVRSLTFDMKGNIWIATDHELSSYDPTKGIISSYSPLDGVDETMCSEGAAITLPDGRMLFGTLQGFYEVDKSRLDSSTPTQLKLRITDFWIGDKLISPRTDDTYDYYVPDSRRVVLPDHRSSFSFRFTSLNYQLQHRVHYQYRLEGYDSEWKNANRSRIVNYTSLPTGSYKFQVKAFLLSSPEKYDIREIEVVVPPFFLMSSGAVWFYMLLIIVAAISLMFWRQKVIADRVAREGLPDDAQREGSPLDAWTARINEWLEHHYSDPALTVSDMEEALELDSEMLAQYTQLASDPLALMPRDYITHFRVNKAIARIEGTNDTLAQIAFECGFADIAAFGRAFKARTGMMPSAYRDQHTAAAAQMEQTDVYEVIE